MMQELLSEYQNRIFTWIAVGGSTFGLDALQHGRLFIGVMLAAAAGLAAANVEG